MLSKKRKGVTLIEVMMVLGVLAILLSIMMSVLGMVQDIRQANSMLEELMIIRNQVIDFCDASENTCQTQYNISETLAKADIIPSKYVSSDKTSLVDVYGNRLVVVYISAKNAETAGYASESLIEFGTTIVNKVECTTIVQAMGQGPLSTYINKMGQDWSNASQALAVCGIISFPNSFSAFF